MSKYREFRRHGSSATWVGAVDGNLVEAGAVHHHTGFRPSASRVSRWGAPARGIDPHQLEAGASGVDERPQHAEQACGSRAWRTGMAWPPAWYWGEQEADPELVQAAAA